MHKLYLCNYPYLKEADDIIINSGYTLNDILNDKIILSHATEIIKDINNKNYTFKITDDKFIEVMSFLLVKILISSINNNKLKSKFIEYERNKFIYLMSLEDDVVKELVFNNFGYEYPILNVSLACYLSVMSPIKEQRLKVINQNILNGNILIDSNFMNEFLFNVVKNEILNYLPIQKGSIPNEIIKNILPNVKSSSSMICNKSYDCDGFTDFPPCMRALIKAIQRGDNLPHNARFTLTAFMNTIGMSIDDIIDIYNTSPDFNRDIVEYQVKYISGSSGIDYKPNNCDTMKTNGFCINDGSDCDNIINPLQYIKIEKDDEQVIKMLCKELNKCAMK